ncbi:PAS domain-containing protein [uncultured Roseivirga sp.]|uniref:PAS domain-containing sensor histidine kinase n=1 Tax=uncultured Roseivirga sp. TaxID=543088 RepID=UPI0030DCDAD6|tara:strand:- start:227 stop:1867 length:1641 start_codon:yes stop_codon:yes gene_type:complete
MEKLLVSTNNNTNESSLLNCQLPLNGSTEHPMNSLNRNKSTEDLSAIDQQLTSKVLERMSALQNMAKMGCWEVKYALNGELISESVEWSDQVYKIYGYEPGEVNPNVELFYSHVHPEDLDQMNTAITESLEAKQCFNVGHRVICKSGEVKYVNQRGEFIYGQAGTPIGMIGITQDLSEKKESYKKLQEAQTNFRNILENTDTGYVLINNEFDIVSFNDQANEFISSASGNSILIGSSYFKLIPEARIPVVKESIKEIITTKKPLSYETNFPLKDGTDRWLKLRMFPIINSEEVVTGITIAADDITQQRKWMLEKEAMTNSLIQRNKALEQFAFIVSHNLRAPLTNIIGLSTLIPELDPTMDGFDQYLKGLKKSADNLDSVVLDLNSILKIKTDQDEGKVEMSFTSLLEDTKANLSNVEAKQAEFIDGDFAEVDKITTIKPYMVSIFTNLLTNSIKYKKPSEALKLSIRSSIKKGNIVLEFKDNGRGIDMKKHGQHIFNLYKRFHHDVEGRGIGLYMINAQIEAMGGSIEVESEPNLGTTFTISLPQ